MGFMKKYQGQFHITIQFLFKFGEVLMRLFHFSQN